MDKVIARREANIRRMIETARAKRKVSECSSLSTVSSSRYKGLERDWWKEKGKEDLQAGDSEVGGGEVMALRTRSRSHR
jgi:hypothetical protein